MCIPALGIESRPPDEGRGCAPSLNCTPTMHRSVCVEIRISVLSGHGFQVEQTHFYYSGMQNQPNRLYPEPRIAIHSALSGFSGTPKGVYS